MIQYHAQLMFVYTVELSGASRGMLNDLDLPPSTVQFCSPVHFLCRAPYFSHPLAQLSPPTMQPFLPLLPPSSCSFVTPFASFSETPSGSSSSTSTPLRKGSSGSDADGAGVGSGSLSRVFFPPLPSTNSYRDRHHHGWAKRSRLHENAGRFLRRAGKLLCVLAVAWWLARMAIAEMYFRTYNFQVIRTFCVCGIKWRTADVYFCTVSHWRQLLLHVNSVTSECVKPYNDWRDTQ